MIVKVHVEIIPSIALHCRELSLDLRQKDREEAERLGLKPSHALFQCFRRGLYRRTALIEDEVVAMWGVIGETFGVIGRPYLVTGNKVSKVSPIKFAKIYKQEVNKMKELFPVLENYVDSEYEEAIRLLKLVGFTLDSPREFTPGNVFYRFSL